MMVTYTSSALEHIHTVDTSPVHEQMNIITVAVCLLDDPQHIPYSGDTNTHIHIVLEDILLI